MKNILKQKEKAEQTKQSVQPEEVSSDDLSGNTSPEGKETVPEGTQQDNGTAKEPADENNANENGRQAVPDEKQKNSDELLDKLQRTMAEFDNYRKRSIKEKASMYDDGVRDTAAKLLPIVDNFERAVHGIPSGSDSGRDDGFYKGVEMILRQVYGLLDEIGVEAIPAKGEKFDHNLHYAVAHIEDESAGENEIIDEMQKGYKYKGKVIRPSMVKVAN